MNVRCRASIETDSASDFPNPQKHVTENSTTAAEVMVKRVLYAPIAPGQNVDLSNWTSVHCIMLWNKATSATVTVQYASTLAVGQQVSLPAGSSYPLVVPNINPATALTLVSSAGTVEVEVTVIGS